MNSAHMAASLRDLQAVTLDSVAYADNLVAEKRRHLIEVAFKSSHGSIVGNLCLWLLENGHGDVAKFIHENYYKPGQPGEGLRADDNPLAFDAAVEQGMAAAAAEGEQGHVD